MSSRRTGRNAAYGLGYLLLAGLGIGMLAYAGDRVVAVLFGLLLLVVAAAGLVLVGFDWWYAGHRPGATVATAPSGVSATAFLRSPVPTAMSVVVPVALVAWAVVAAVLVEGAAGRVVLVLVALLFASPLVAVARGRIAPGGLYLTPAGVEQRKEAVTWSLAWDAVSGVVPGEPLAITLWGRRPESQATTRVLWRREPRSPAGALAVDSRYLAADPVVVAAVIGQCLAHPELRQRLGTPEVISEIRTLEARR